jgi:hypothetical protein
MVEANEDCISMLQKVRWMEFLLSFRGHNLKIARAFTQTFNGQVVKIGNIEFQVIEAMIVEATHLPLKGEFWSKTRK